MSGADIWGRALEEGSSRHRGPGAETASGSAALSTGRELEREEAGPWCSEATLWLLSGSGLEG